MNPGEDAAAKFAEVARAYEVLSDKEKRQVYDLEGACRAQQSRVNKEMGGRAAGRGRMEAAVREV